MTQNNKSLEILHLAMSFGLILIIGIFYYLRHAQDDITINTEFSLLNLIGTSIGIIALLASQVIFRSKTKNISSLRINIENFDQLRPAYILKWALIDAAGLINAVFFFLTGNLLLLYFSIALCLVLYLSKPRFY